MFRHRLSNLLSTPAVTPSAEQYARLKNSPVVVGVRNMDCPALTFHVAEQAITARRGDFVFGPRRVPHTYTVGSGPARCCSCSARLASRGFIRESGEPAAERIILPPHVQPDLDTLPALAAKYGCELIG